MHVSNQGDGRVGHHSDFITDFPGYFFHVRDELGVSFDLEVEAKAKEAAIMALRKLHPSLQ
jgi:UV DNA damage repair endonuclease